MAVTLAQACKDPEHPIHEAYIHDYIMASGSPYIPAERTTPSPTPLNLEWKEVDGAWGWYAPCGCSYDPVPAAPRVATCMVHDDGDGSRPYVEEE